MASSSVATVVKIGQKRKFLSKRKNMYTKKKKLLIECIFSECAKQFGSENELVSHLLEAHGVKMGKIPITTSSTSKGKKLDHRTEYLGCLITKVVEDTEFQYFDVLKLPRQVEIHNWLYAWLCTTNQSEEQCFHLGRTVDTDLHVYKCNEERHPVSDWLKFSKGFQSLTGCRSSLHLYNVMIKDRILKRRCGSTDSHIFDQKHMVNFGSASFLFPFLTATSSEKGKFQTRGSVDDIGDKGSMKFHQKLPMTHEFARVLDKAARNVGFPNMSEDSVYTFTRQELQSEEFWKKKINSEKEQAAEVEQEYNEFILTKEQNEEELRPFTCSYKDCKKDFRSADDLRSHKNAVHCVRRHVCRKCQRGFKTAGQLTHHYSTHSENRPFKCNVENCGKLYKRKSGLNLHIKTGHPAVSSC